MFTTIDIQKLLARDECEMENLKSACNDWGLFMMVNHGISSALLEKLAKEIENFFKLPVEDKEKFFVQAGSPEGLGPARAGDTSIELCHRFFMYISPASWKNPSLLPNLPYSLREKLEDYFQQVEELTMRLLKIVGGTLGIGEDEIQQMFKDGITAVRMNMYPKHIESTEAIGISSHSDATSITLLSELNGVGGLEVLKDDQWMPVRFVPGSLVVILGDNMEILSNGKYRSAVHRVTVNPNEDRLSLGVFQNPGADSMIGPSKSVVGPGNPPRFRTISVREYIELYFSNKKRPVGNAFLDVMRL